MTVCLFAFSSFCFCFSQLWKLSSLLYFLNCYVIDNSRHLTVYMYMSVFMKVYLSAYLSIYQNLCLSVCKSDFMKVYLSIKQSLLTFIRLYVCLFEGLFFICLLIYQCLFVFMPVFKKVNICHSMYT